MSNIQVPLSFQEKIIDNLKKNLGDLLSDEDYKKILQSQIHDTFFRSRKNPHGYQDLPPLAHEVLLDGFRPLITATVQSAVKQYLEENPQALQHILKEYLDKSFEDMIKNMFSNMFLGTFIQFKTSIEERIRENFNMRM